MAGRARAGGSGTGARLLRRSAVPAGLAAVLVLLFCGAFGAGGTVAQQLWPWGLLVALCLLASLRSIRFRLRERQERRLPVPWVIESSLLLLVAAQALARLTGGPQSALVPLQYLLGAGFALALPLALAGPLIALQVGLDVALVASAGQLARLWPVLLAHAGFTVLFAALYHALLGGRLLLARRAEREAVRRRVAQAEERARELRLVATADPRGAGAAELTGPESPRERQLLAAVAEVEEALQGALAVGEAALGPHSIALFLLSTDGATLRLRECLSQSEALVRDPLPAGAGALGAVLQAQGPLRLCSAGPELGYYEGRSPVSCFLGVPLLGRTGPSAADAVTQPPGLPEPHREPLGVLAVDRATPFTEGDERLVRLLAEELVRSIEGERLLSAVRGEKEEKARFFRALEALNRTRTAEQAARVALEHAQRLAPGLGLCAVTLCEEVPAQARPQRTARGAGTRAPSRPAPQRLRHRVLAVHGEGTRSLEGLVFADNPGLVASVVRLGAPLPGRPLGAMERPVIFDGATTVRGLAALKIFPLRAGEETVGTLVCGSRERAGLPAAAQAELGLFALQVAQALVRARLYETAERLATTDGLTGLLNRRSLDEQLHGRFTEAVRYGRSLSFVLVDVDHFKKVNDNHGHPAGDAVLRGVAAVVSAQARATDRAARYGGEEMALLLPETDLAGALVIAERLRAAVEASSHATEAGELRVTVSVGVSAVSGGAGVATAEALLEAADQALYRAKKGGRNRVEAGAPGAGGSAAA